MQTTSKCYLESKKSIITILFKWTTCRKTSKDSIRISYHGLITEVIASWLRLVCPMLVKEWTKTHYNTVYDQKKEKHSELINYIRNHDFEAKLYVIIVSSLGAVLKDSICDINRLFAPKLKCNTIIRMISRSVLNSSMSIWYTSFREMKIKSSILSELIP